MNRSHQPISLAGSQLGEVRHVCAFFTNDDEEYRVLLSVIRGRFALWRQGRARRQSRAKSGASGPFNCRRHRHECPSGSPQFEIHNNTVVYLQDGCFDQDRMLATLEEVASAARTSGGFPLSRIVCRIDWASSGDLSRIEDVIEFEAHVNEAWRRYDDAVIRTYQLSKLSGDAVIDIMRTHSFVIFSAHPQRNPFYIRLDEFLHEYHKQRTRRTSHL